MAIEQNGLATMEMSSTLNVSELTVSDIHSLSKDDLIQVILAGRIPFLDDSRLDVQDVETLRRLAFLARNCAKNQAE